MDIKPIQEVTVAQAAQILAKRPVFLVGSAISQFAPTQLPAGGSLASQIIGELISYPKWLRRDAEQLPFEAILESYPRQQDLTQLIANLYGKAVKANYLHQCLAQGLRSGQLKAIITTNYDLAMEPHLPANEVATISTKVQYEEWAREGRHHSVYFKIHGSAEENYADTLVFTLTHEGILSGWKKELVSEILTDSSLVVVGYSGKDFELCPQIARLELKHVYWLQLQNPDGTVSLTPNATKVLGGRGTLLTGSIQDAIPLLLGTARERLDRTQKEVDVRTLFEYNTFEEWKLRLLDRLACPSMGLQLAKSFADASNRLEPIYCRMLGHAGKYRQAAKHWTILSRQTNVTSALGVQYATEASGAWFVYGNRRKSKAMLRVAEDGLAALNISNSDERDSLLRLEGGIFRVRLTWLRRDAQRCWSKTRLEFIRKKALPDPDWVI